MTTTVRYVSLINCMLFIEFKCHILREWGGALLSCILIFSLVLPINQPISCQYFVLMLLNIFRSSRSQMIFKILQYSFTGKHLCWSLFLIKLESLLDKVSGLQVCNFFKRRLQRRCFPVNIAKFLIIPFLIEHLQWLLLNLWFSDVFMFSVH